MLLGEEKRRLAFGRFQGGAADPNERPADAAIRECFEETGLIKTTGLMGVFGGPEFLFRYPNGDDSIVRIAFAKSKIPLFRLARLRQISTIVAMLDDFGQMKRLIDAELAEVERKKLPPAYPCGVMERRAMLQETVGSLEMRLTSLRNGEHVPGVAEERRIASA